MLEALPGHISSLLPLQGEMWRIVVMRKLPLLNPSLLRWLKSFSTYTVHPVVLGAVAAEHPPVIHIVVL